MNTVVVLMAIAIISGTLLRASLLVLYPVVAFAVALYFRLRVSPALIILLGLSLLSMALSIYPHFYIRYNVLSLYYLLPFLLLFFSNPPLHQRTPGMNLELFIRCLCAVAVLNDVIGFAQIIRNPGSDDSFTGLYSEFSVSINGLMLLNAILFYYYLVRYANDKQKQHLAASLFFLASALLGFYGAGLVIVVGAFVLSFFRIKLSSMVKTFLTGVTSILLIYFLMLWIKPDTLEYNLKNIRNLVGMQTAEPPRKLMSFANYLRSYPRNLKDFFFGSGPGTFNSRSAFMIGSPSYFSKPAWIKDPSQPYYFKNFAYSLWNESNTRKEFYEDGFRNQPFSSILAFLGEYGAVFTLLFFILYYIQYKKVSDQHYATPANSDTVVPFRYFKFLCLLLPLLFLIDNYLEYPEIMLLILLGIKFAQMDITSTIKPVTANVD